MGLVKSFDAKHALSNDILSLMRASYRQEAVLGVETQSLHRMVVKMKL